MTNLESEFHQAMFNIYYTASRDLAYTPYIFYKMVAQHGGVETARRLLSTEDVQYGFDQLWEHGRLDLTVEYHVLQPCFKELFDENTQNEAARRLKDLGYFVDEDGNLSEFSSV